MSRSVMCLFPTHLKTPASFPVLKLMIQLATQTYVAMDCYEVEVTSICSTRIVCLCTIHTRWGPQTY